MLYAVERNYNMFPLLSNSALVMSIGTFSKPSSGNYNPTVCKKKHTVTAATVLCKDSATEIIDVFGLSQKTSPLIQYAEIAEAAGRLYCIDGHVNTSCWLKIVTIAKDCQSSNVLLMKTGKGVILKVIRSITPGEPLLMWFTENILAMLNMPYLQKINFKENRYICHVCNNDFEYPNPLKIHLALQCNRLDSNHLWTQLAKEFNSTPNLSVSPNFLQNLTTFNFNLKDSSRASPVTRISPFLSSSAAIPIETNINKASSHHSSSSSNQTSPSSSTQASPTSPSLLSFYSPSASTMHVSPVKKNVGHCHSAFKPYMNKPNIFTPHILPPNEKPLMPYYQVHPQLSSIRTDAQAASVEAIASNLGKGNNGHVCIYCGKLYSRKYGLKIHIRTHTGYKPLKCKFCDRPFGDPSNLNKHIRLHSEGETPYKCDLCGKVLVRRRDLERHMRSRHQENADQ